MKKIYNFLYALPLLIALFAACSDKEPNNVETPTAKLVAVTGIEKAYSIKQNAHLKLKPVLNFSEGTKQTTTYEWIIDNNKVSTADSLDYECTVLGKHTGTLKVIAEDQTAKFADFTFYVYSGYDQGLLLFTEGKDGAMLAYKSLDVQEAPAVRNVFAESNPTLSLGKTPLALCWTGECITNPNNIDDTGGLEVIVSTDSPRRIYALNASTMSVLSKIDYDGTATDFSPNHAFVPFGMQNRLWGAEGGSVYFTGNGKDYLMTPERRFVVGKRRHQLPAGAKIADLSCSLITNPMDMLRVYFDTASKHLVYIGGIRGMAEGKVSCPVTPMALLACDGSYAEANADNRYEPKHALLVGSRGGNGVTVYRFAPTANKAEESLLGEMDATGHILPTSAVGVNPVRPLLYYADHAGNIYVMNYEGKSFSSTPYISLGQQYDVKAIVFNPYNPNRMYVAAEDSKAETTACASIFIIDVSNKSAAKVLYKEDRVGGKIHRLIYKGNGKENREATHD